ncbi:four-carbon acid sugar kinase family protein [Pseudoclavibacter terrae]|uniref:Four-carbon acid sugar kinase family protein n=1 Tax=Pseudoclavibacter terrae TaxID=1530195 RepID=A0A7J5B3U2_9MICO|nr:four-carbon acid sugar kinase family protein [Pseudoclavibacter terrae]KAB1638825.1 four-carbon acid sugar kinase family protein [Pseudoclavibacter terrae]
MQLTVIADDLSGAVEAAGALGPASKLLRDPSAASAFASSTAPLVVDTDSRSLTPAAAEARARSVLDALSTRPGLLVKKIDSQLRGNIATELRPLAARGRIVMTSAAPSLGRTVRAGRPLVGGEPLATTAAWQREGTEAPEHLQHVTGDLTTTSIHLDELRALSTPWALGRRLTQLAETYECILVDAETATDLARLALGILNVATPVTAAGAADLARALAAAQRETSTAEADHRSPTPPLRALDSRPVAVVVGSPEPNALAQVEALRAAGATITRLDPREATVPVKPASSIWVLQADPVATVHDRPGYARAFAKACASALADHDLVLTGGETAGAFLDELRITTLTDPRPVHDSDGRPEPGIVTMRGADGRLIATKPGSFGGPSALLNATTAIQRRASAMPMNTANPAANDHNERWLP